MDRNANGSPLRNIIAVTVIAAASAGVGFVAGRDSARLPAPVVATKTTQSPLPAPTVTDVTLERADIIRLANVAADAASGGPPVEDMMDGRRFVIRIPFGCGPLTDPAPVRGASYTIKDGTLRIIVLPQDWTNLPWVASELSRREAVGAEGFWIPRPWTGAERCPAEPTEAPDSSSSLGIAQPFDSESSRVGLRRGRALEATVQVNAGEEVFGKGLRLVIEGRIVRWPGGRETVLCRAPNAYERPVCLVGTKLDSISIENPADGERLANWRP